MEPTKYIWMNGKFIEWDQANTHILTHAFHYGTAVFEGIRCYKTERGSAVFRLAEHMKRLVNSAQILGFKSPFTVDDLVQAAVETIRKNEIQECYLRPIIYLGYGSLGVNPVGCRVDCALAVFPWAAYLGEEGVRNGVRVKVSSFVRGQVNSVLNAAKTAGNYVNSVLAKREAIEDGYAEAIMLTPEGFVAEASGENLFVIRDGQIVTPPRCLVLEGITRDTVIRMAADMGTPVVEEYFTRDRLYIADELFMTGTAAEITPIREVDRRAIGTGKPGPVTCKFQEAFKAIIRGKDERYSRWLTYV